MKKFWIIAVAGFSHLLFERFSTYEDAKKEAQKRAERTPGIKFNILGLESVVTGESTINVTWEPNENIIYVCYGVDSLIKVELTDRDGKPLDLKDLYVQFIVLPKKEMGDETALFNETKRWVSPEQDPYPYDGFKSNVVEYIIGKESFSEPKDYWYQVRIHYAENHPTVYKEGLFSVIKEN